MQLSLAGLEGKCNKKMQIPTSPSDPPLVADLVLPGVLSAPPGEGNKELQPRKRCRNRQGKLFPFPGKAAFFSPAFLEQIR